MMSSCRFNENVHFLCNCLKAKTIALHSRPLIEVNVIATVC